MGGGRISSGFHRLGGVPKDEFSSSFSSSHPSEFDFQNPSSPSYQPNDGDEDGDRTSRNPDCVPLEEAVARSLKSIEEDINETRGFTLSPRVYPDLLDEAKDVIRRYKPGMWIEHGVGGIPHSRYDVPTTTVLLLVGPRESGKSNLVNRISRIFEEGFFYLSDRAQVSYNISATEGTCFLKEYMIPTDSTSFCLYDSRSLSGTASDDYKLLKRWMTDGVKHGEMVLRGSDSSVVKENMKAMARNASFSPTVKRAVNFVIFVVNGLSILQSINNEDAHYTGMVVETFNHPFMSFKDDKPVIVVTHGDKLSVDERDNVCLHLGKLLGIPPTKQIFNIPDATRDETELTILTMLRYCLEHADRNLPLKKNYWVEEKMPRNEMFGKITERPIKVQWMLQNVMSCFQIPENFSSPHCAISQHTSSKIRRMMQKFKPSVHKPQNFGMMQLAKSQVQWIMGKISNVEIRRLETCFLMLDFILTWITIIIVACVLIKAWA